MLSNIKIHNPVIIFSNGIGDHFLVLPTIRALSHLFKDSLSLVCQKNSLANEIFCEVNFNKVIEIDFYEKNNVRRFDPHKLLPEIYECDLLISLNPWGNNLDIIDLLNGLKLLKFSIGFYKCFSITIPFDLSIHNIDLNFKVAQAIDNSLELKCFSEPPQIGKNFSELQEKVSEIKPKGIRILTIHTDTEQEKMWSDEKFIVLLDNIMERHKDICIIPVGISNLRFDETLRYGDRVLQFDRSKKLSFKLACAYISISDFFIGIDSVFLHVADLFKIPGVAMFGPTSPIEFGFKYSSIYQHILSSGKSMTDINVAEVEDAVERIMKIH